ncbi:ABC transporter ATP-binding protein [Candidatus Izimaplasma bacterium ZiA1]|uniref:ABC transporter ATP-binding protein n=1 Tax=Candidatus Izimoplasma sp. ZiA1 TaxID=2024899 RepID=UPI000BAA4D7B|nr:ABC transporter ATP-binding protein [Candidatus Izimaplasma bacterium ZiA1]
MRKTILNINNLSMQFGGLKAVDDLSFDIKENEIVGLIGPNGAGKTTVFNCITQFYKDDTGEIIFENKAGKIVDLNKVSVTKVINHGLVRTFQNVELVKDLSIIDNVLIGGHNQYKTGVLGHILKTKWAKLEEKAQYEKALKILKFLNLDGLKDFYAYGQPYGILKKIEIARTLMCNPKLIILDEPAAGLNDVETKELAELIHQIKDEYKCSILLVEHDMGFVMDICDRICAISFGKLLAFDTPKNIQSNKTVQEAYLGGNDDE